MADDALFLEITNISATATDMESEKNQHLRLLHKDRYRPFRWIIACINLVFSIPAILGNLLILLAIRRTSAMGLPSKVLLGSLAFSDFSVGLIVHPSLAFHKFIKHKLARHIIGLIYDFASGHLSIVYKHGEIHGLALKTEVSIGCHVQKSNYSRGENMDDIFPMVYVLCAGQFESSTSPPGNPPGIWTFEDWLVQIPSPRGKKAVQMPHQLVLNRLSSKTNLVFNQALYKCLWEKDMP